MFLLSDTIVGALIAFLSASLGAGLTAIITWKTTKLSVDSERKHHIREEKLACYSQLISAYYDLHGAMAVNPNPPDNFPPEKERSLYTQFQSAKNHALLICDDTSQKLITEFSRHVTACHLRKGDPRDLLSSYDSMLQGMRKEIEKSGKEEQRPPDLSADK